MTINKEGYRIITITAILCAAITATIYFTLPQPAFWTALTCSAILLFLVASFFRQPNRPQLSADNIIFSPADGKIVAIEEVEEKEYLGCKCIQVSVFMSVSNVHINWFPVGGKIEYYKYHPGKFLVAWHPKSSEENERTTTVVDTGKHKILFRQIAGFVARRIVSYARAGETVGQNDKCGFIKFGSKVDVFLPLGSEVLVEMGQKVTGSITHLARVK